MFDLQLILLDLIDPTFGEALKQSTQISPYNALGYGFSVMILMIVSVKLYYDLKKERAYIIKLNQEVLSITNKYIENSVRFEMAVTKTAENREQLEQLIKFQTEIMNQIRELKIIIQSKYM